MQTFLSSTLFHIANNQSTFLSSIGASTNDHILVSWLLTGLVDMKAKSSTPASSKKLLLSIDLNFIDQGLEKAHSGTDLGIFRNFSIPSLKIASNFKRITASNHYLKPYQPILYKQSANSSFALPPYIPSLMREKKRTVKLFPARKYLNVKTIQWNRLNALVWSKKTSIKKENGRKYGHHWTTSTQLLVQAKNPHRYQDPKKRTLARGDGISITDHATKAPKNSLQQQLVDTHRATKLNSNKWKLTLHSKVSLFSTFPPNLNLLIYLPQ